MSRACEPERIDVPATDRHTPALVVTALGTPVGQGRIRHLGKGRPAIHANAEDLLPWREKVQYAAMLAIAESPRRFPLVGPVAVTATFTVRKPLAAPKTRRTWPVKRPDTDHLVRAVLDALTAAGCWGDDSQVIEETGRKVYPNEHPAALHVPGVIAALYAVTEANDEEEAA